MSYVLHFMHQILRKRANKENESNNNREAKRAKLPSRRVSFAPDDELSTMHLYQKVSRSPIQGMHTLGCILCNYT